MQGNRTAIVTGGSRGIGRSIAIALGIETFNVLVNYVSNTHAADEVCQIISQAGGIATAVQADISKGEDRQALLQRAADEWGRIDLLVNNAGVAPAVRAEMLDATEESFDRLIATNLKGPYFLTQLAARQMIAQPGGPRGCKIINITSVSAYTASTNRGDYCVAKAGLSMTTKLYAAALADHGINVYEVRPGIIETDMTGPAKEKYDRLILKEDLTPIHRWGQPEDVGRAVVALANDMLPFSTGEVINVDGGFHLRRL